MTEIFNDGVLEAIQYPNRWVFVRWMQNKRGKLQKQLIRDLIMMENRIFNEKLLGWFTLSETNHKDFHKLLIKFGATKGEMQGNCHYFLKPLNTEGDLHVRKSS